ncbi:SDR family oxidoreductase [Actinospica robiniae]|uniref:SDR family oxidoreductase n=1 Tax=Actinospica robiniae TaxID=304901 RepID=UPI0003F8227B|nr:SDR family oxidoreductase [Actinospica robiniae]
MRIMVIGGSGYLGSEVVRRAGGSGHEVIATSRAEASRHHLDITSRLAVASLISQVQPQCIINAAYRQDAWAPTAIGPGNVALAAAACGAHLIQVSSDSVFSGRAPAYPESSYPDPLTPYGAAKAAAETAIQAIDPTAAIVRTSLIVGDGHSVHEQFVRALISGENEGVLFTDVLRCPVHVADLAAALLEIAEQQRSGILHAAGPEAVSRYDLGCMIARRLGLDEKRLRPDQRATTPTPGPLAVRLDSRNTQSTLRTALRGATEFLDNRSC